MNNYFAKPGFDFDLDGTVNQHNVVDIGPYYNRELENKILGTIIVHSQLLPRAMAYLKAEMFYYDSHQKFFSIIEKLYNDGKMVDRTNMLIELRKDADFDSGADGIVTYDLRTYLNLEYTATYCANIEEKCLILTQYFFTREVRRVGQKLYIESGTKDSLEVLDEAQKAIEACWHIVTKHKAVSVGEKAREAWAEYDTAKNTGVFGMATQYKDVDAVTLGRHKSDLVIIAARPGHGKTTIALNEAYEMCKKHPAIYFSLEMPTTQLLKKIMAMDGPVALERIRKGTADHSEEALMEDTVRRLIALENQFFVYDITSLHINDLISIVKTRKRTCAIELVYVDYLQLMQGVRQKGGNRDQEIGSITRGLKKLAMEEKLCVVAMSQLNREADSRADKRPQLSDLRESGNIEQDADVVELLYRPELYGIEHIKVKGKERHTDGILELTIPKNRNGSTGVAYLDFNGKISIVKNMQEDEPAPF